MEYLQNAQSLCLDGANGKQRHDYFDDATPDSPARTLARKKSQRRQRSLLDPVTWVLKSSADLVKDTVFTVRDGLTEDEREAKRMLKERKQILALRLKNVSAKLVSDCLESTE